MAIKYIINGYFRSGTTLLWKLVSETLSDTKCFYEPLHPKLPQFISPLYKDDVNELHGFSLWNEYIHLDEEFKAKINTAHPNLTIDRFTWNALKLYFDVYNSMEGDVLLQTNRPHHHLSHVSERYEAKLVHIVRHPYFVYTSIVKAYESENTGIKGYIKRGLPFGFFEAFEIQREYNWIKSYVSKDFSPKNDARNIFDQFCFVYCLNNYAAINSAESNGLALSYDKLVLEPDTQLRRLEHFLSIDGKSLPDSVISSTRNNESVAVEKFEQKFKQSVEYQGLEQCYEVIKNTL